MGARFFFLCYAGARSVQFPLQSRPGFALFGSGMVLIIAALSPGPRPRSIAKMENYGD